MKKFLSSLLLMAAVMGSSYAHSTVVHPHATAVANPAAVDITIHQPQMGPYGNDLKIAVAINSTFEIKSVKAIVEGREVNLTYSTTAICFSIICNPGWIGSLSLSGLARGNKVITVTATDVFDNVGQNQGNFIYDQPPTVTVTEPLNETVARPAIYLDVTCADDDPAGCSSVTVYAEEDVVATGKDSIKGFLFLNAYDGRDIRMVFAVVDSRGQRTYIERRVFVESSNQLSEVEVLSGRIMDVQPDRILFLENSNQPNSLKILDRATRQQTVIPIDPLNVIEYGFLTPKGAIFTGQSGNYSTARVYDWRDGTLVTLDLPIPTSSLKVKGNYAIWNEDKILTLRDLVAGTNIQIADQVGNNHNDLAGNGDVVYWSTVGSSPNYAIFRYRGGVTTQLTHDNSNTLWNTYPVTDGINVVYNKRTPCCTNQQFWISLYDSSGETNLDGPRSTGEPSPGYSYALNGGWIAFDRQGISARQVWTRSPSQQESQITFYGTSSTIKGLSPMGGVVVNNENHAYLKEPNTPIDQVGSSLGNYFWQDGQWLATIGRTLFRINTTPAPVPTLMSVEGSQDAIALNGVTWMRSPFKTITTQNLSSDHNTRVMLLAANMALTPGDNAPSFFAQAEDSHHKIYSLPVEYVGKVPNFDWLTQINVRLPDELAAAGTVWISVNAHGQVTNRVSVNIQ